MTTQWSATVSQIQQFLEQHLPSDVTSHAGLGAAGAILGGVVLCVLGAKLARVAFTIGWALAGGMLGLKIAEAAGIHSVAGAAVFAAGLGMIGYMTYRLWVGVLTAGVLTAMVLAAFGYHRVAPRLEDYNRQKSPYLLMIHQTETSDDGTFTIPTQQEQAAYRDGAFKQQIEQFWSYVQSQDQTVQPHMRALTATALVFGLLIGLSSVRMMLILSTALLGTVLLGSGFVGVVNLVFPGFAGTAAQHPIISAVALGLCLLVSIILQARLTRARQEQEESPEKEGKKPAVSSPARRVAL